MNNELALSSDLNIITAEINSYKQVAGQAIFEIGRRLKHVKENDLVHGEWEKWCRNDLGFTPQHANKFIKVNESFQNRIPSFDLGIKALYEIATMPEEERNKKHTFESGEKKTLNEMTVRELREVKKALKQSEEDNKRLGQLLTEERNKPPKVETKVVERVHN